MRQLAIINPENVTEEEVKKYQVREAARAIVIDDHSNVALLHLSRDDYYKLPGGGIEVLEDKVSALKRECKEEIGCSIDEIIEIGIIVEYRKLANLKQTSYCYFAKVKGEKGTPRLEEGEIEEGMREVWLPYENAVDLIKNSIGRNDEQKLYIIPRDSLFLEQMRGRIS